MNVSGVGATNGLTFEHHNRHRPQLDLSNTASALGISASDLQSQLTSGSTLADIAKSKGVSTSDLTAAVEKDLQASAPQGAPSLSDSQLGQMASDIINGKAPSGPPPSADKAGSNLQSLADSLGMDPSALLQQLSSGMDLSSLLSGQGDSGYGSTIGSSVNGGVAFDQYA